MGQTCPNWQSHTRFQNKPKKKKKTLIQSKPYLNQVWQKGNVKFQSCGWYSHLKQYIPKAVVISWMTDVAKCK
jgi:hypothetical protein